jgi:Asp/Glu/hydantoin racemase
MNPIYLPGPRQPDVTVKTGTEQAIGGCAIGILVLDLRCPLFPGNVANASTWNFPVLYKILKGAGKEILDGDRALIGKIIDGGRELEDQGVRAIIGACGYFANYQKEAAAALKVPAFMSSLLQVPMILQALRPEQKIGVVCAYEKGLTPHLYEQVGIEDISRLIVSGAQDLPEFQNLLNLTGAFNSGRLEAELIDLTRKLVTDNPEVGAILIECSDMPPYAHAIQNTVGLPVFDFYTLINWVQNSVVRKPFAGFL